jgi:hypothetical protein
MTCCLCDSGTTSPAPKCKNTSCRICLKVANVDTEIKRAVATLQSLLTKRCDLRSERNHTHDITHQLPLELKNRIFELALPTRDEWGGDVHVGWPRARGKTPSYLTSICRNWRDTARSNPFLWSTIPIVLGTPSTSDPNWVVFVYDWIQRSRNSPLNLHISIYDNDGSEDDMEKDELEEQLNDVLDVMAQCPNEWQSLSLKIPISFLKVFHDSDNDFKSHLLTVRRLQIISTEVWEDDIDEPVQPVPPTMSPEMIDIDDFSFKSLPISCNHLTFAKVIGWDLEDIAQLFQHASQMIFCGISYPQRGASDFAMPPIIHRMLQKLHLRHNGSDLAVKHMLLDSLTLPCLRAIETDIYMEITALLPSLLRRSSCPLTRITILDMVKLPSDLNPLTGVTDLVLKEVYDVSILKVLLLEGYFPDLRHLTLPLHSFIMLWETGVIPMLRNRARPNEVPLRNIFVVGSQVVDKSHPMWDSDFGKQLKAFQSSISLREDGFEFLIPEVARGDEDSGISKAIRN